MEIAASDELIKKLVAEDDLIIEEALFHAIQKGQENGDINPSKDPKVIARFLCNTVAGMRVYAKKMTGSFLIMSWKLSYRYLTNREDIRCEQQLIF